MKKKIISFCTAVVMSAACIPSVSAATLKDIISALPNYETKYKNVDLNVDTDIELKGSSGNFEDGPYTTQVPAENPKADVSYKATLYMSAVRDEFTRYWTAAKLLCGSDTDLLTQLDNMPVSGEFTITVKYPDSMQIPNAMVTTVGQMYGFNEDAKYVFKDVSRDINTGDNILVIKIKVKDPSDSTIEYVKGKTLNDNLEKYLCDLTLTCEGVPVTGVGTHRIIGEVTGWTKIGDEVILAEMNGSPNTNPPADPQAIAKVTYKSVQITTDEHPKDQNRVPSNVIYEDVILATPAPTLTPGGSVVPVPGGTSGGGGVIAGDTTPSTDGKVTPAPVSTIVPAEAGTTAELDHDNHYAYIIGYPEGDVRPGGNITRAEVATIFFRMLTDDSRRKLWTTENNYSDVELQDWYNNAISTMTNARIVNGYEDGSFRPDAPITRAEFAAIISRFINGTYSGADKFSDITGHWAAEYINRATHYDWIHGYEDGTYRPDQNITRAEAMTLVNNVLDRHVEAEGLLDDMVKWPDNTSDKWYYTAVQEATNSHYYDKATAAETWTSIRDPRDWAALETELSTADSAGQEESIVQDLLDEDSVGDTVEEVIEGTEEVSAEATEETVEEVTDETAAEETTEEASAETTEEETTEEVTTEDVENN